ncbi:thiamine-phosphate synthase family protein [Pyrococcus kukulkanii]|uniref:thiamine-phosphate synthase family protein n=1 Tax=Pyrococcus kukulkanii TaxID=1609559 RepID=UPI0035657A05
MRTPSSFWAEVVLPAIRARIAKILYSKGYSQIKIAKELGVTQAMVSKYLSKYSLPEVLKPIGDEIDTIALTIAEMIEKNAKKEDIIKVLERKFFDFLLDEKFCRLYEKYSKVKGIICREILPGISKKEILDELARALDILLNDDKFPGLIPEIRSNFAYAMPNPKDVDDVAAIPGRITLVKERPYAMPPEFGVSRHTARLLIKISRYNPSIRAVLNVRFGEDVERALEKSNLKVYYLPRKNRGEEETEDEIAEAFREESWDVVVDLGGYGVEPCVYIFGRDPLEVVGKLKKIEQNL